MGPRVLWWLLFVSVCVQLAHGPTGSVVAVVSVCVVLFCGLASCSVVKPDLHNLVGAEGLLKFGTKPTHNSN